MNPIYDLAIDLVIQLVLRPEIERRFGANVPGKVLAAASTRVRQMVREGKAGDYVTAKKLTLYALDETLRELDKGQNE